jgi:hypothetical protein
MSQDDEAQQAPTVPAAPVPPGSFVFGPRPVATTSVLLAVASLGTLVLVATQKNVDALSTIALALAILAFGAQLIIYIAQAATSNQQLYLSQVVQTETARMLAGIQASAESQLAALDRIIPRLVSTTISAEQTAEEGEGRDAEATERIQADLERLTEQLGGIVREELAKAQSSYSTLAATSMIPIGTSGFGGAAIGQPIYLGDTHQNIYGRHPYDRGHRADPFRAATEFVQQHREDKSNVSEDPSKISEPPAD